MPLQKFLSSEYFYDIQKKGAPKQACVKKIESSFYALYTGEKKEKTREFSVFIRKNILIKRGEIFLEDLAGKSMGKFFLRSLFEKLRCEEYTVYSAEKEMQNFLESLGFSEISEGKFSGKFHSSKNDSFQKIPDVMVIDGGKGQLSSVAKSLLQSPYCDDITLCSLAKREEEIFLFNAQTGEISLTDIQKNSPEGHFLQRIRDEAHRFAITKNRKGRAKETMKSVLDEIKGLGPKMKKLLKQKGGVPAIREMSDEALLKIVPEKVLVQLREKL